MAKLRLGGAAARLPNWPIENAGFSTSAPALTGTICTLVASTDRFIKVGTVLWADGATHNLHQLRIRTGTVTAANFTMRYSIRALDTANGPPVRDDGVAIQSGTQANPSSNTVYTLTLGADASYAHGADIAVVVDFSAYTSGSVAFAGITPGTSNTEHRPQQVYYNGATYALVTNGRLNGLTLIADDGTIGYLAGDLPCATAVTAQAFASNSASDEWALEFTVAGPVWAGEMGFLVNQAANADFSLVLYEDTTAKATFAVDANTTSANAAVAWVVANFPDVALTSGHTYRIALKPTTTNNVTLYYVGFTDAAEAVAFTGMTAAGYNDRVDGGAWGSPTAVNNLRVPMCFIGFTAVDNGAGTGGARGGKLIGGSGLIG